MVIVWLIIFMFVYSVYWSIQALKGKTGPQVHEENKRLREEIKRLREKN